MLEHVRMLSNDTRRRDTDLKLTVVDFFEGLKTNGVTSENEKQGQWLVLGWQIEKNNINGIMRILKKNAKHDSARIESELKAAERRVQVLSISQKAICDFFLHFFEKA